MKQRSHFDNPVRFISMITSIDIIVRSNTSWVIVSRSPKILKTVSCKQSCQVVYHLNMNNEITQLETDWVFIPMPNTSGSVFCKTVIKISFLNLYDKLVMSICQASLYWIKSSLLRHKLFVNCVGRNCNPARIIPDHNCYALKTKHVLN